MAAKVLASLADVRAWINVTKTTDDDLLSRLIAAATRAIQQYVSRDIFEQDYVWRFSGNDGQTRMFPQYPVSAISLVQVDQTIVPASDGVIPGYVFDDNQIWLIGHAFRRGSRNCIIKATAGFRSVAEQHTVSDDNAVLISALEDYYIGDVSASLANGTALTKVSADATPSASQYNVDLTLTAPAYQFGISNQDVLITYQSVPRDIERACVEIVGYWYKNRDRIGVVSQAMAGTTTAYSQKDLPNIARSMLDQHRKVMPI